VGTPLYTSPEVLKRQPFDFKVDMWALGCLLYYMACLEPPFNVNTQVIAQKTAGGKPVKLENKLNKPVSPNRKLSDKRQLELKILHDHPQMVSD